MYNYFGERSTNPYISQYNAPNNAFSQRQEVARVNGENGARAFQLPPNSSILLLDETQPLVWLKTSDSGGYPTLTPYSISPYQAEPQIDTNSLEQRITNLEQQLGEMLNAKSDAPKSKQTTK